MNQQAFFTKNISFWNIHSRWTVREKYIDYLLSFLDNQKEFYRIIDIGCGCGQDEVVLSRKLKEKGIRFEGVVVDQCPEAMKYVNARFSESGAEALRLNTYWQKEVYDFFKRERNDKFDIAICSMLAMYFLDVHKFMDHISRCINVGGFLLLVVNNPYLIADEYGLPYIEGKLYSHAFMIDDTKEEFMVEKFFHTIATYFSASYKTNFQVIGVEEICEYSDEIHFYNSLKKNPKGYPNFLAFVLKKNHIDL